MIYKQCPRCSGKAVIQETAHAVHQAHIGHKAYEMIKHSPWMRAHPVLSTLSMVGLGVAAVVKVFEKHHYKCNCGHTFEA